MYKPFFSWDENIKFVRAKSQISKVLVPSGQKKTTFGDGDRLGSKKFYRVILKKM